MAITDYDTTPGNNTLLGSIPLGENLMSPDDVNDAFRKLMADIAQGIVDGDFASVSGFQAEDATLTALAGVTTTADDLILATGADAFTTLATTAYGRSLLALADLAALKSSLGGISLHSSSFASPGYIKLDVDGDGSPEFMMQWGTGTIGANTTGTISYPQSFSTFAICVVSGGSSNASREGDVHVYQNSGLSSQAIIHSSPGSVSYQWIAVGGAA